MGSVATAWPSSVEELDAEQRRLAAMTPEPWHLDPGAPPAVGGCFVCFPTGLTGSGAAGDRAWAAACVITPGLPASSAVVAGTAGAPYWAGFLALREGPILSDAVTALPERPDVLLVNAAGLDHPRRAGLAIHLGEILGIPTVGVTHRPFLAHGSWPPAVHGATATLTVGGRPVAAWVRTRASRRPLVAHPGWRTDLDTAVTVVANAATRARTPEPLRRARQQARWARARSEPS